MNPARYSLAGFSFFALQEIVWVNSDEGADWAPDFSGMHACTHARRKDENTKSGSDARTRKDARRREKPSLFFAEAAAASLREHPIARGWRSLWRFRSEGFSGLRDVQV
jgi:hypothetical protein